MSYGTPQRLRSGGDPRTLPDYTQLRDELSKLTHPARPDVDWQQVETLCLNLFSQNGVELQTAAWYTQARTRLAGLHGLCEGLAVLEALLAHQWGSLWPQPVHARMEILVSLSQRLQQAMRTLTFLYTDLGKLYQAEQHLSGMGEVLQRLELKHVSQLEALRTQLHNAAVRLENSGDTGQNVVHEGIVFPSTMTTESTPPAATQWIFVAQQEPAPRVVVAKELPPSVSPWKSFTIGALTMLVVGSTALWGWQVFHRTDPLITQLNASLAPLTEQQLANLKQKGALPGDQAQKMQQQLNRLSRQSPVWAQQYGNQLVRQAQVLWPEQGHKLAQQWQQQLNATALPVESLNGWHQGMEQLQQLSDKLNALDERKGRYLTGSELKTMVYDITRSFNRAVPVEEQLRQLAQTPQGQPLPAAQQSQTEMSLNALLNRYALTVTRPALDSVSP